MECLAQIFRLKCRAHGNHACGTQELLIVLLWLLAFSSFHLHDPAHPQIILSVASLSQVYDCYAADFLLPGEKKYFPHDHDGELYLPSRSYFLAVWRTHHQVGRKKYWASFSRNMPAAPLLRTYNALALLLIFFAFLQVLDSFFACRQKTRTCRTLKTNDIFVLLCVPLDGVFSTLPKNTI